MNAYEDSSRGLPRSRVGLANYAYMGSALSFPAFELKELDLSDGLTGNLFACQGPPPALDGSEPVAFKRACIAGAQGWEPELKAAPPGVLGRVGIALGAEAATSLPDGDFAPAIWSHMSRRYTAVVEAA